MANIDKKNRQTITPFPQLVFIRIIWMKQKQGRKSGSRSGNWWIKSRMGMGKRKRKRKRGNRSFILIFQTFSIYEAKVILNRYYHQMPYHIHFKLTLICRNLNQKNFKARACNLNLFTGLIKSFTVLFSFLCNQLTLLV